MTRIARIAVFVVAVTLATVPVLARGGGGGHGGGGHCGGAHGGGGGPGGAHHPGSPHGPDGHGFVHGKVFCGNTAHFCGGVGGLGGWDYLDRIGATPGPDDSAADDAEKTESENTTPARTSSAEADAQYRYDHRTGGD